MKWLLILLAVLVGVIVVCLLIGALIPRRHSASVRAAFEQPPEVVYDTLLAYQDFVNWRSGVKKVEERASDSGQLSWVETSSFGDLPLEVVSADRPRQLVLRIASDELPFGGTWTYRIESAPEQGGCVLSITEDGEVENAFFRFMSKFVFGYHRTMETYLRDLGRKFDQEVEPARA